MSKAVEQAQQALHRNDVQGAAQLLKQAEQAGDAAAARELAVWLLEGKIVRRSLARSRSYFERAADLGDEQSSAVARAFIAGGVGGASDWPRAIELLREAVAKKDSAARAQLDLIQQMALGPTGEPE